MNIKLKYKNYVLKIKEYFSKLDLNKKLFDINFNYFLNFLRILFKLLVFILILYFFLYSISKNILTTLGMIVIPFQIIAIIHVWFTRKFPFWGKIIWSIFFILGGLFIIIPYFFISSKMN